MAYDDTNRGTLGKNRDKEKPDANPKWPDYKGKINVDGVEYWLDGWIKEGGRDGGKFISLSLKRKDSQGAQRRMPAASMPAAAAAGADDPFADDIPFN